MRDWIKKFLSNFDISPATTQASVVQFSDRISNSRGEGFPLLARPDTIRKYLTKLRPIGGGTYIGAALKHARTQAWVSKIPVFNNCIDF